MKRMIFVASALLLSACASSSRTTSNNQQSSDSANERNNQQWFCQLGEQPQDWDCVQDENAVANPKPIRLPTASKPDPSQRDPRTGLFRHTPRSTPDPATPIAQIEAEELTPAAAEVTSGAAAPSNADAQRSLQLAPAPDDSNAVPVNLGDLPPHIALSYRPEKPTAILDLPANFYAVQLVAVSSKENLEAFALKHKIRGMSAARTWNGEQLFYVLLLGIYEDYNKASQAVASLTAPFDLMDPWIRSLGSLQNSMLEADAIAGTTEI